MVKSPERERTSSVPPFLKKCYEMVDDEAIDSIISWGRTNDSFVIWDMTQFSVHLLPKYFKHSNFSSFMRQLNIYGFRKIDTDRWEFASDGFIRGQKHLLKNIFRRKNIQSQDQHKTLPLQVQENSDDAKVDNNEKFGLWKEVENLKTDKNALMQEFVKLRQHQETAENKLLLLRDRLQGMEKNQQQMLSFLVMVVQSPGFLAQLLQPKENNWHMAEAGNMLEQETDADKHVPSDGVIVKYQPLTNKTPMPVLSPIAGSGKLQEPDIFSDGMKDFFLCSDFVKMLMDDQLCSLENHGPPFMLPDVNEDNSWEQLLLANPFSGNTENRNLEGEEGPYDSAMEMESTPCSQKSQNFELLMEEMERSQNIEPEPMVDEAHIEKSKAVEFLTEQMGLLASKHDKKQETQKKAT